MLYKHIHKLKTINIYVFLFCEKKVKKRQEKKLRKRVSKNKRLRQQTFKNYFEYELLKQKN